MDKAGLSRRLMATFLGELEEHVRALNRDLLALEKTPAEGQPELVQTLFRTAHSLKGAAHSVSVQPIEAACHRLETILGAVRDGHRPLASDAIELAFAVADALRDAGERLRAGRELSGAPIHTLLPQLDAAERRARGTTGASAATPSTSATNETRASTTSAAEDVVRVPAAKLDALLARSGELLVARRRVAARHADISELRDVVQECITEWRRLEGPLRKMLGSNGSMLPRRATAALDRTRASVKDLDRRLELLSAHMAADIRALEQVAAPLDDDIRHARMLPFRDGCEGLERLVRDVARASGKQVDLVITGGTVEIDRAVLDGLKDPVLHLVRNAIDHGVEAPEERSARGKPARATITVAAALRGHGVEVIVADDGRGLDIGAIREQARRRGLKTPEDDREAAQLIFLPGFSTTPFVTELSGRGVGLDVVRHGVDSLRGHVRLASTPGHGMRVILNVPLTLTTIRALLVTAGGQTFALPTMNVRRLTRIGAEALASIEGRDVLPADGAPVPVAPLADVLGLETDSPWRDSVKLPLVTVASGDRQVAFLVDTLIAEQELVVKSLGRRLRHVRYVAGATMLASGRVALILNAAALIHAALGRAPGRSLAFNADLRNRADAHGTSGARAVATRRRLLLVEDSVTTRTLEKSILEAAGYDVLAAVDGSEAWRLLQEKGADLVVADVEMPHMDGFTLCEAIRGSKRFRDLPVVLVTALESDRDKARGLEAGADAYLPKSAFDQRQLLEAIARLL